MHNRVVKSVLFLLACLVLGTVFGVFSSRYYQSAEPAKPDIDGLLWPSPKSIGPFEMVNQDNKPFNQQDLANNWTFLFFGYTHCPDVCPITLSVMNRVYQQLQENNTADNVQMIFVSVDPERDTPEKMDEYVNYFNRDFIGLTGTASQLENLTKQMGIVYAYADETAPDEYLVDHTASIFLLSPQKRWTGIFTSPHDADNILDRFHSIRRFISDQAG